jgi:antioxidant, ahpC/TSA family
VAVSIDQAQNINKVKPLVDQNGWRYDVLLDPNGELRRALGIQMIPFTVLLDGKGNIVYKHNGYTDGAEVELYEKVKEAAGK